MRIQAAIITVSDTRNTTDDLSGDKLATLLVSNDAEVAERLIVTDELADLRDTLQTLADRKDINLIVTTGGTGFGPRDNTPEATLAVIEREAPGLSEAMRRETASVHPFAMLSRGICGIRGTTLIINLPGSPKGVEECFNIISPVLAHAVNQLSGDTKH